MSGKQKPIDLEPVLQWIRDNSTDGIGPARSMYHSAAAKLGLPSYSSLQLRKWTWPALCAKAGVERRQAGRPPIHTGSQFLRRYPGAVPASVEEEMDLMRAHAEPPPPCRVAALRHPDKDGDVRRPAHRQHRHPLHPQLLQHPLRSPDRDY